MKLPLKFKGKRCSWVFNFFSPKMSKAIAEVSSMKRSILDVPYEILFDIFRRLPKDKLIEASRLCSKFRDIAGDTRFWKDAYIKYKPHEEDMNKKGYYAFEELYSESWPVKVIDLNQAKINPPVSSKTVRVVKVTKLDLSSIRANKATTKAILTKYQCTELHLDWSRVDLQGRIMGIAPETFSKQTALERLSLVGVGREFDMEPSATMQLPLQLPSRIPCGLWLAPVLRNCKHLKTLDLTHNNLNNLDMMGFVKYLPTSLENLRIQDAFPLNSFFESLAKSAPNLRELELNPISVKCSSLLKLRFLKALHIRFSRDYQDISDLYGYISKFPALEPVHILHIPNRLETQFESLKKALEPHGIIVRQMTLTRKRPYLKNGDYWEVSHNMARRLFRGLLDFNFNCVTKIKK